MSNPERRPTPSRSVQWVVIGASLAAALTLAAMMAAIFLYARLAYTRRTLDTATQRLALLEQIVAGLAPTSGPATQPGAGGDGAATTQSQPAGPNGDTTDGEAVAAAVTALRALLPAMPTASAPAERADRIRAAAAELRAAMDKSGRLDPGAVATLASAEWGLGDATAAKLHAEQAVALGAPGAGVRMVLANALARASDLSDALAAARAGVAAEPTYVPARELYAVLLQRAGQLDAALTVLDEALRIDPQRDDLRAAAVRWLMDADQLDAAAARLDAAPPAGEEAGHLRAELAVRRGDYDTALTILVPRVNDHPADAAARRWLGVALLRTGALDEADTQFAWLAEHEPARPDGAYWQGLVRLNRLEPEKALALFEQAIGVDASFAPAWESAGIALANLGRLPDALERLDRAASLAPGQVEIPFAQAVCLARLGQRDAAIEALKRAVALRPSLIERARSTPALDRLLREDDWDALAKP